MFGAKTQIIWAKVGAWLGQVQGWGKTARAWLGLFYVFLRSEHFGLRSPSKTYDYELWKSTVFHQPVISYVLYKRVDITISSCYLRSGELYHSFLSSARPPHAQLLFVLLSSFFRPSLICESSERQISKLSNIASRSKI